MKITATQIKQNSAILQQALREDIVVTKRQRPFVVIVEYEKYRKMEEALNRVEESERAERLKKAWLKSARESESVMGEEDAALYDALEDDAKARFGEERA
ncbi:type II toxin-antitoxin system prevent-host-death family antitoxin [Hydrogenimonas sp.]